jgi:hypothetical protein
VPLCPAQMAGCRCGKPATDRLTNIKIISSSDSGRTF